MANITLGVLVLLEVDFSRMDGTKGETLRRHVTLPTLRRLFPHHCAELEEVFFRIQQNPVRTSTGFWYNVDGDHWMQKSGSPDTSADNSIVSIIVMVTVLIICGMSVTEAWEWVEAHGCVGGDDGVLAIPPNLDPQKVISIYTSTAGALGLKVKIVEHPHGSNFYFLGRWWNTWGGVPNSYADPMRTLTSLPFSTSVQQVRGETEDDAKRRRLIEKANAIIRNDANTVLIGDWARAIVARYGDADGALDKDRFWAQFDSAFYNEYDEAMWQKVPKEFNVDLYMLALKVNPLDMPVCYAAPVEQHKKQTVSTVKGEEETIIPSQEADNASKKEDADSRPDNKGPANVASKGKPAVPTSPGGKGGSAATHGSAGASNSGNGKARSAKRPNHRDAGNSSGTVRKGRGVSK